MSPGPSSIDAERLLREARWVRRLARKLVRDDATAEDLVQETWLAALESAPAGESRLRPWLARVVRNFAAQSRRGEAHRAARELGSARPEGTPSTSETAERLEAQRRLVGALTSLEEPYRTTVTLRYLDGLSAAQIARKLGIPAGTVRWRLKHGLDELRAKLGRRVEGTGSHWAIAVIPLLRRPSLAEIAASIAPAGAAGFVKGVMLMSTTAKLGTAAALLLVSTGVWIAQGKSKVHREILPETTSRAGDAAELAPGVAEPVAHEIEDPPASAARGIAIVGSSPPPPARTRLEVRFVDSSSNPLRDVRVEARAGVEYRTESGADGKASADVEMPEGRDEQSAKLVATCPGHATQVLTAKLERGKTTWLGDVVLAPGGALAGVVLGPDGLPFPGADVQVTKPELPSSLEDARRLGPRREDCWSATSGDGGSFRVDGVPAASMRVWAGAKGMRWGISAPIEVQPGEVYPGVRLALEPLTADDRIEGVVLAPDGSPVPWASLRTQYRIENGTSGGGTSAGADGRFRILLPRKSPHDIHVEDAEGRWPVVSALAVAPGTLDLVLRFVEPRRIDLEVRDPDGTPIERYRAYVRVEKVPRTTDKQPELEHPGGRLALMLPSAPFRLQIVAKGHATAELGPLEPDALISPWICTLDPLPRIRGRVIANGEPVSGARVTLVLMPGDRATIEHNGFPSRFRPEPTDAVTTAADGIFQLDAGKESTCAILGEVEGYALAELSPVVVGSSAGLDDIELVLSLGGTIEGRVIPPTGRDATGTLVAVSRNDGRPKVQRVGPDGRFDFTHLTPGRWQVKRVASETHGAAYSIGDASVGTPRDFPWDCTVEEGKVTPFDIDLSHEGPCVLVGQITLNGAPASGWTATVDPDASAWVQDGEPPGAAVDSEGRFRIEIPESGAYLVKLRPPAEWMHDVAFIGKLAIHAGENSWPIDVSTGGVRGRCLKPEPIDTVDYGWSQGDLRFAATSTIDAEGRFSFPLVPSGPGRVSYRIRPDANTILPGETRSVEVVAGSTLEVELP